MRTIVLAALLVAAARLYAEAPAALTLDQCLALAKKNSPVLRIASGEIEKARLAASELRTTALPQVRARTNFSYAPDRRNFGYDPAISDGGQLGAQVELEQSVYDAGVRKLKITKTSLDLQRLAVERQIVERDLLSEVRQRFIEVLRAQREIELQQESVDQLKSYFDLVQDLRRGGAVGYTDLLKSEVQLRSAGIALQKARESAATSASSLSELAGLRTDSALTVTGDLSSLAGIRSDTTIIVASFSPERNPDLRAAGLDIEKSGLESETVRRERRPLVDLTADAGWLTSRDNLNLPASGRYGGLGFSAGFTVALPLFNGGATNLRLQQKQLETESFRLQSQLLERSLTGQSQRLQLQIRSGLQTLTMLQSNIQAAEQNFLLTKSAYAGGGTSATEVLTAQQLLVESKLNALDTEGSLALLSAQLEQLTMPYTGVTP